MLSTNKTIQECNYDMIRIIPTPEEPTVHLSRDICKDVNDQMRYDADWLNKIETSGLPPHRLILKVGAVIILIKNLTSVRLKHVNGGLYLVAQLTDNLIFAQKLGAADGDNSDILIPHIPTISKDTGGTFKSFKRTEFPVLVTYYLTLNRAQGQTLQRSEMYLPRSVFSH